MKQQATVLFLSALVASILFVAGLSSSQAAHANQMEVLLLPAQDSSQAHFTAFRTIGLRYPEGSTLASMLAGKDERLEFSLQGKDAQAVAGALNRAVQEEPSPLVLENATVDYVATLKGYPDGAQLFYKVDVKAQMSNYVLQKEQGQEPAILDMAWRSPSVQGPVVVAAPIMVVEVVEGQQEEEKDGEKTSSIININQPAGALDILMPGLASKLVQAGSSEIMQDPILDFGRFDLPMQQWHFLFDVTGEQLKSYGVFKPGEGETVSVFSIGESSFREGVYVPKERDATISVDGEQVKMHASTPPPSGQMTIAGYAKAEEHNGVEYMTASSKGTGMPVLGFQLQVLMALGGMMGAIAVFVLVKTRRST
ncbi:MAG TPA: hypothetical protein VHA09_04165 [Nitrososphaera sp.]|nr:hypothetical protein [Nitrososphaera sp.]